MLLALLPYLAQLLLIVHAIKTGQNFNWIWLLVFLPGLGGIIYVILVLLPELRERGKDHVPAIRDALNPLGGVKKLQSAWELSPTPHNRLQLAREYLRLEQWENAAVHVQALLDGYFKGDRELSLQYALCKFRMDDFAGALELYTVLIGPQTPGTAHQEALKYYSQWHISRSPDASEGLGRIFRASDDLECGWLYARCLHDQQKTADIRIVLDRMKLVAKEHRNFKKTMDTRWIAQVGRLL